MPPLNEPVITFDTRSFYILPSPVSTLLPLDFKTHEFIHRIPVIANALENYDETTKLRV